MTGEWEPTLGREFGRDLPQIARHCSQTEKKANVFVFSATNRWRQTIGQLRIVI
jgi:hypothetical protein